jgi:hypothetical protein
MDTPWTRRRRSRSNVSRSSRSFALFVMRGLLERLRRSMFDDRCINSPVPGLVPGIHDFVARFSND